VTEPKQKKEPERKERTLTPERNTSKTEVSDKAVLVGQKPVKNYTIACMTAFTGGSNQIVIKARGRAICKAVDTFELLRRAFMKDVQLQEIKICTEQVTREGDRKSNVSAIEITLTKP
jgi:DNA-binding protein